MNPEPLREHSHQSAGILTFLIADVRGYTAFTQSHGDEAAARLATRFADIMVEAAEAWGGRVIELRGDEALAVFDSARAALRGSLAAQARFAKEQDAQLPLRVGIGLDAGEAIPVKGGYRGGALNLAARLCSIARAGETLASRAVVHLARSMDDLVYLERGEVALKGLAEPVAVFQVVPADAVPERVERFSIAAQNTLPPEPTPFIGRKALVAEVSDMLCRPDVRLLTLIGPGGTGKTRLAIQAARESAAGWSDGVVFVDLASVAETNRVVLEIAAAFGIREVPGESIEDRLIAYLRDRCTLLILDNMEHLTEASTVVTHLIASCEALTVLVTSRIALRLAAEHQFHVPPLGLPDLHRLPDLEALAGNEAVSLFIERARGVRPHFTLTAENAAQVAEICVRLDGLPLAIELAAARIRMFPPRTLLSRLSSRLKVLTAGARDAPERQQTLRSAIDWSYRLLSGSEQTLLARLSVFAGGCTLDAAETICAPGGQSQIDALDGIASLVDKSLLRQDETGGESRFLMLDTIREYAAERLDQSGEHEAMAQRHARYFDELLRSLAALDPRQPGALLGIEPDMDNVRAALDWGLRNNDPAPGLALLETMFPLWERWSAYREAGEYLDAALARGDEVPAEMQRRIVGWRTYMALRMAHFADAETWGRRYLAISRAMHHGPGTGWALHNLGITALAADDFARAWDLLQESLSLFHELDEEQGKAVTYTSMGHLELRRERVAEALNNYAQGVQSARHAGARLYLAAAIEGRGWAYLESGDVESAERDWTESLAISTQLGDRRGIASSLEGFAAIAVIRGDGERAARLYGCAAGERDAIHSPHQPWEAERHVRRLDSARALAGDDRFEAVSRSGQLLTTEDALVEA